MSRHPVNTRRTTYAAQAPSRWPDYMRPIGVYEIEMPEGVYGDGASGAAGTQGIDWSKVGETAATVIPGILSSIDLTGKKRKELEAQNAALMAQLAAQSSTPQTDSTWLYAAGMVAGVAVLGGLAFLALRK